MKTHSLSLVLPCYNEEAIIADTISKTLRWASSENILLELIVVDDGSHDNSRGVLRELEKLHSELVVVEHKTNLGYASAIRSGIDIATKELVGFMDSDGQFRVEDLSKLLQLLESCDFAAGIRAKRADPLLRKLNAKIFNLVVRILFQVSAKDIDCGMKIFRRSLWTVIRPTIASGALLNAEMFLHLHEHNIRFSQIEVHHAPRTTGKATGADAKVILQAMYEITKLASMHMKYQLGISTHRKNPAEFAATGQ